MIVKVYQWEDSEWFTREELHINGERRDYAGPLCECPEDAIVGRDLISPSDIAAYMREAYEAGKAGQPFEFELIEKNPEEM